MTPDELDDLIYRYLAGAIDETDHRRLENLLASNPNCGRRFAELSMQETLLRGMGEADLAVECEPVDASSKRLRPIAQSRNPFWRTRLFGGLAAAVVLIASGVYFYDAGQSGRTALSVTVIEIRGSAIIQSGAKSANVINGVRLTPGDTLKTAADSDVRLQYPDNTLIDVLPGSELMLLDLPKNQQKRLRLQAGALLATVVKQPANLPLLINTPQADVTVVGTVFEVRVKEAETRLEVKEGTVRMMRLEDRAEVNVVSGQSATATPDITTPLTSIAIPDGTYVIKSVSSGLALADNNSRAVQQSYAAAATQQWKVKNLGGAKVSIVCVGTNRALEVPGSNTTAGINLQVADYSGASNQQWTIVSVNVGRYEIINAMSNLQANVAYESMVEGGAICQWVVGNYPNGVWTITPVSAPQRTQISPTGNAKQ